ncbi:MAG: 3'(2'),5'-bisphosphate nucleotidase CysQ [Mesorhizobium sp.]
MPAVEVLHSSQAAIDLQLIRAAAEEAGRVAMRFFKANPEVWMKGGQSPVSEADYAVDTYLRETLLAARPEYGWLSEETVDSPARLASRRTFVVDPIDGTRAFLEGRSTWCVSIAVVENGVPLSGVLECPAKSETFWAQAGSGAFKNGAALHVNPPGERFTVAGPKHLIDATPENLRSRFTTVSYIPSLAYRVAMVASGELDATYVKPHAHDWDLAAADVMLREAGGRLLDCDGKALHYAGPNPRHGALAAGSGALLEQMTAVITAFEHA